MTVSVVIPLYNKAGYLGRALDSACAQRHPPGEILVVNDGSTDGGPELARQRKDPRLRVIDQPRQGVSAARNAGVAAATGTHIAFLDADDYWDPGYLEAVARMIAAEPGAGLYGTAYEAFAEGCPGRRHGWAGAPPENGACVCADVFGELCRDQEVLHTSASVVPKAVLERVGGFSPGVGICEDVELWVKIGLDYPVALSPEVLAHYDTAVPGQATEYFAVAAKPNFAVLAYHRFLARQYPARADRPSFQRYCRKFLGRSLFQRLYWADFAAAGQFYNELGLARILSPLPSGMARLAMGSGLARRTAAALFAGCRLGKKALRQMRPRKRTANP